MTAVYAIAFIVVFLFAWWRMGAKKRSTFHDDRYDIASRLHEYKREENAKAELDG